MDEMEIIPPEEIVEAPEATEVPAVEEHVLEDATYDADAHVEQSGNFEQSEAVETTLTEVVDSVVEEPAQTPVEEPKITQEVDPVTGQSKPSSGGSEETGAEEEPLVVDEDQSEMEDPAGNVTEVEVAQTEGGQEADAASDAAEAQREGEEYGDTEVLTDDEKPGTQTPVVEQSVEPVGDERVDAGQIEEPQIEKQLPNEEILAAGMGKHGLIPETQTGKKLPGTGGGYPGQGKGTSGGGPPVGQYGAGSKGQDKDKIEYDPNWTEEDEGYDIDSDVDSLIEWGSEEDIAAFEREMQERALDLAVIKGDIVALTLDGGTPMPYTGSFGDGDGLPPDTSHKPPEGPDREASFLQMVVGGGRDTKRYYGYGSSGSATFSPSGGGDTDDSGKYYGGLFGGGSIQDINPDDFDYYTPNVLQEALKKEQRK